MSKFDIVRAWKDAEYCESLSDAERTLLPENPAGVMELTDAQLAAAGGAEDPPPILTVVTWPILHTVTCVG